MYVYVQICICACSVDVYLVLPSKLFKRQVHDEFALRGEAATVPDRLASAKGSLVDFWIWVRVFRL